MQAHQLELLSPARDIAIGMEAINHGADAVYIGGPAFGARLNAANSMADIAKLTAYAHRFNARIFLTLNTIFRDDELEAARQTAWQAWDAGVDALIVQDMGLLQLDLPPIQLHASTQTDIRTPEKARFLQDVGFSKLVLARELDLEQIKAVHAQLNPASDCLLEFFIHGALCVAYSGQCTIGEAHVGRSANRGECNQACRLPYKVQDAQGRFIAHDKHVLSMKDNDQSANMRALVDAGVRSFKIEGRYKDMGYVKNITGHYRQILDAILQERPELAPASSGSTHLMFKPEPEQNFNRGSTDYFVNGRKDINQGQDIGAFDSPKHAGMPFGWVTRLHADGFELQTLDGLESPQGAADDQVQMHNGDGLTYLDLQKELVGVALNRVERLGPQQWRVWPKDPMLMLKDLRKGVELKRNRDMSWLRTLAQKSSVRKVGVWLNLTAKPAPDAQKDLLTLELTDENGISAQKSTFVQYPRHFVATKIEANSDKSPSAEASAKEHLSKLGSSMFEALSVQVQLGSASSIPPSVLNQLRRDAVAALEAARQAAFVRLPRAKPVEPPVPFPQDTLSYLGNVLNTQAHAFYTKHGVGVIEPAYEAHQELGEVSLMITKHCVRWSMSLCPKQAKGVVGVKGTIKAEPLMLINGSERLTLKFDCKPCEMHVVGKMKRSETKRFEQEQQEALAAGVPMRFYKNAASVAAA